MRRLLMCAFLISFLGFAMGGCVGLPCSDNDDGNCMNDLTGKELVCNMAVPPPPPLQGDGSCQVLGDEGDYCGEDADCVEGLSCFGGACASLKIVFVTGDEYGADPKPWLYTGDLGGLDGADEKCQYWATQADLPGTYKAWLSISGTDAKDRLTSEGPFVTVDGIKVADDLADILDCTNPDCLLNPIDRDASGTQVQLAFPWTATDADGLLSDSTRTCGDWTNGTTGQSDGGVTGSIITSPIDYRWTIGAAGGISCNAKHPLYCFQQ